MKIVIIAAKSRNNAIGIKGDLPWDYPIDWEYFLSETRDYPIIMGYITYQSLKKITNNGWKKILISSKSSKIKTQDLAFEKLCDAVKYCSEKNFNKIFLIGGELIFKEGLKYADEILLTQIDKDYHGDRFFPDINRSNWKIFKSKIQYSGKTKLMFTKWKRK